MDLQKQEVSASCFFVFVWRCFSAYAYGAIQGIYGIVPPVRIRFDLSPFN